MGNIKATFAPGMTEATVHGLTQWDYGRMLEISCADLPTIVEVHFACAGMKDALVRTGTGVSGSAVVAIPDICLEQAAPITAWVYYVDDAGGHTALTITLPIIARARPAQSDYEPADVKDSFADLVAAVNEAVGSIKNGDVMVANAAHATSADRALQADSATTARKATNDAEGNDIPATYRKKGGLGFQPSMYFQPVSGCLYLIRVEISGRNFTAPILWAQGTEVTASLGCGVVDGETLQYSLRKTSAGELKVDAFFHSDRMTREQTGWEYSFCQI